MASLGLIIFGITSNLAQIKLIPALYDIAEKGLLPDDTQIIGVARQPKTKKEFTEYFHQVLHQDNKHHHHPIHPGVIKNLYKNLHYVDGYLDDPEFYQKLQKRLKELKVKNKIFYLATYPDLYHSIFSNLKKSGLGTQKSGWVRVMVEKPIGHDLSSAQELNTLLLNYFEESQIYRLDHYLGKETLQNILAFRFSNGIFEPLINKNYIDHIQITAAEDYGVGLRGGYYDTVGALKDVGQNHQLQMLAFATMDSPKEFSNEAITKERLKILRNIQTTSGNAVFGQYKGYKKEANINPKSQTETFYAMKVFINNDRFKNVPIYIRAGKKLTQTVTEIVIVFKSPLNRLFKHLKSGEEPNVLIYRIQPNEGIVLKMVTKKPGHQVQLDSSFMQFCYRNYDSSFPDAYEKLIADVIKGDQTFFNSAEEVEAQWAVIEPFIKRKKRTVVSYTPGSWGPKEADKLIQKDGRNWLEPSMDFCAI